MIHKLYSKNTIWNLIWNLLQETVDSGNTFEATNQLKPRNR